MPQHLIRFDWAIKRLLRSKANFDILEGFLSELLKHEVKILNILESESNKDNRNDKSNKVDILVKLETGEIVLIEVQVDNQSDYFYRMLFGTSRIVSEYINEGAEYDSVKKVYSINILYFDLGHGEDYIYHGSTSFIGMHKHDRLDLSEKQKELYQKKYVHEIYPEYYLIKANQFNDIAKDTIDEWIYFLKNDEIKEEFTAKGIQAAKEKLSEMKLSPAEKQSYKRYLEELRYENSMYKSKFNMGKFEGEELGIRKGEKIGLKKGKIEGEKIGIEKGKTEGEKIGIEKGEKLGLEKGKIAEKIEIAKKMKAAGMTNEAIQKITGLDINEIAKI